MKGRQIYKLDDIYLYIMELLQTYKIYRDNELKTKINELMNERDNMNSVIDKNIENFRKG